MKHALLIAAGCASLLAAPIEAATNLRFEEGGLSGWTLAGSGDVSNQVGDLIAADGDLLGYVVAGEPGIYSRLSQVLALGVGDTLTGKVGFQAFDYGSYEDDAFLRIGDVDLFASSVSAVGDYGNSGWQTFRFTALSAGTYTLELGVRNFLDDRNSSYAALSALTLHVAPISAVPAPASWTLMVAGFGLIGTALRRPRRTARQA